MEFPRPTAAQIVPPPTAHMVPLPPMFVPGAWLPPRPPQSMADSSPPCRIAGVQPPSTTGSKTQVLVWTEPMAENLEDNDLQAWEAEALYANGENDADLKKRAIQTYEEDHKDDGPFMFEHCWEVLKKQPKWDTYLERLEDLESGKRKFAVDDEVGKHFTLDDVQDERPPGGKQAKGKPKRKRNDEGCIIDLEDELSKFVEAQTAANEGRKEMLETQRRVSSENLEARKLACLAAKDHKESVMLETYRSLMMQDMTGMSEDVRSEHVLALKCFREKLFEKTD
ncbi:hypothetical protein D1007_25410 [Hordeum vulgare]|nr:hypothetical protein D1007_25410 [Hordeum vulgare]